MSETIQRGIIEVGVDASGVKTGIADANKAISSLGQHASSAADAAGSSIQGIGSSAGDASKKIDQETRRIINSIQRQIAQTEAGERGTAKYYAAMANQKGVPAAVLEPYIKQLDQVTQKQNMARAAAAALDPQVQKLGMSHKQLSFAMRQVPMQFTDIAVGLATGQRPLMVMLQQGGQLKDLFGGIIPAAKALGSYVLRLVNPFTLAAAALGGLAYAYYEGASESERLNKALIATGNSAGTTANDMTKLAGKIGDTAKAYGTAREAAEALAGSGRFTASQLEPAMRALTYGVEVTGSKISDLVTEMENIAGKPTEAIIKLNEKYNFLTKDIYEQIKAHEKNKNAQEAARIAFEAYANAMESRKGEIQENLGYIESAWKSIKLAILSATDAALNFGRASDPLKEIDRLQKDIAEMEQSGNPHVEEYLAASKAKLQSLQAEQQALAKTTAEQAKQNQVTKDYIKIDQENEKKRKKKSRKSPEENAYERLISSIKRKIEENELEILTGQALTEAQKMQIKYQSDLATGRIKLTAAQKESTQALLDELSAIEQKNIYSRSAIEYDREFQRVMRDMVNDYNLQIDLIGKTAQEAEKLTTATHILRKAEEMVSRSRERGMIDDSLADRIMSDAKKQADTAKNMIDQRYAKENDPWVGLTESVRRYGEEAGKQGEQIGNAFNNAMSSAEDAWVEFVQTGKLSFKGLMNSVLADLARMQFQSMTKSLLGSLFGGLGGASSGGGFDFGSILSSVSSFFGGARALGGPVTAGAPYVVGEKGPELFMPSVSGSIVPNDRTSGAASVTFAPTINIDSRSDRAQVMADTERMLRQSQAQLIDKLERQGRLS